MNKRQFTSLLTLVLFALSLAASRSADSASTATGPRPQRVLLKTAVGDVILRLDWEKAPESCATFVRYTREGIYSKTQFDDFDELALFGGKPSMEVSGTASNGNMACDRGPKGEFALPNVRGAVGFRRTVGSCNPDKRSNCTQIYVRTADNPKADGEFTVFSKIENSAAVVEAIRASLGQRRPVSFSVKLMAE